MVKTVTIKATVIHRGNQVVDFLIVRALLTALMQNICTTNKSLE